MLLSPWTGRGRTDPRHYRLVLLACARLVGREALWQRAPESWTS
jgi:hypothetical protein